LGGIIDVQRGSECSRVVIDAATVSDVDAERGRCEKGRGCFGGCDRDGNCDGLGCGVEEGAAAPVSPPPGVCGRGEVIAVGRGMSGVRRLGVEASGFVLEDGSVVRNVNGSAFLGCPEAAVAAEAHGGFRACIVEPEA
jgi:hypothetical protein